MLLLFKGAAGVGRRTRVNLVRVNYLENKKIVTRLEQKTSRGPSIKLSNLYTCGHQRRPVTIYSPFPVATSNVPKKSLWGRSLMDIRLAVTYMFDPKITFAAIRIPSIITIVDHH